MTSYQNHGFDNRRKYLESLAEEYDVPLEIVLVCAQTLGPTEDFDGLISMLIDYENMK